MPITLQLVWLFTLAIPVACLAWTITHEEVFREPRDYCQQKSREASSLPRRKFFYLFTCEYCFSHYVAAFFLIVTRFKLLYVDWRGYLIALFALVWIANQYMSIYNHLRLDIKQEQVQIKAQEKEVRRTAHAALDSWSAPNVSSSSSSETFSTVEEPAVCPKTPPQRY